MDQILIVVGIQALIMLFVIYAQRQEPERFQRARPWIVAMLLGVAVIAFTAFFLDKAAGQGPR